MPEIPCGSNILRKWEAEYRRIRGFTKDDDETEKTAIPLGMSSGLMKSKLNGWVLSESFRG